MITSVIELLMSYFPDSRPVTAKLLERKCSSHVLKEAVEKGYIREIGVDCDGYGLFMITEQGRKKRNN